MSCPSCTLNESIRCLARLLAADQTALIVTDQGPADTTAGCAFGSGDRIDSVVGLETAIRHGRGIRRHPSLASHLVECG
jgi:hypothetical protein